MHNRRILLNIRHHLGIVGSILATIPNSIEQWTVRAYNYLVICGCVSVYVFLTTTFLSLSALSATTTTFSFFGQIKELSEGFVPATGVEVGTPFAVHVAVDDDAPVIEDIAGNGETSRLHRLQAVMLTIGDAFSETIVASDLDADDGPLFFGITGDGVDSADGADVAGIFAESVENDAAFALGLADPSGQLFGPTETLEQVFDLFASSDEEDFIGDFEFGQAPGTETSLGECAALTDPCSVSGDIETVEVAIAAVPVPASAGFLLAGLGGFAALRRLQKPLGS